MNMEPFVSAEKAAAFLGIRKRYLQDLARKGLAGSYPIGTGDFRKRWVFKLSELAAAIDPKTNIYARSRRQQRDYDFKVSGRSPLK